MLVTVDVRTVPQIWQSKARCHVGASYFTSAISRKCGTPSSLVEGTLTPPIVVSDSLLAPLNKRRYQLRSDHVVRHPLASFVDQIGYLARFGYRQKQGWIHVRRLTRPSALKAALLISFSVARPSCLCFPHFILSMQGISSYTLVTLPKSRPP